MVSPFLAFLAGILSILSPCVLPLVPVVLGAAVSEHRFGSVALAAGLALSFLLVGLLVATVGFSFALDPEIFRMTAAVLLAAAGIVLAVPPMQAALATAAAPIGALAARQFDGAAYNGLTGQFGLGALLGVAWSPCVGPTLGAASVMASQGRDLGQVALVMGMFAVGTALPLLGLGMLSREVLLRWRGPMLAGARAGKTALGLVLVFTGVLIISGYDRSAEEAILKLTPSWLTDFSTRL